MGGALGISNLENPAKWQNGSRSQSHLPHSQEQHQAGRVVWEKLLNGETQRCVSLPHTSERSRKKPHAGSSVDTELQIFRRLGQASTESYGVCC